MVFTLVYAILRHRLMDIEVVIKKGVVYSGVSAGLVAAYVGTIALSEALFRGMAGYSTIWASIPAVFVLTILFNPLRERVQNFVDRVFFRQRYRYQQIFKTYADTLVKPLSLPKIAARVPYVVFDTMKLSRAFMIMPDKKTGTYVILGAAGRLKERTSLIGTKFRGSALPMFDDLAKSPKASFAEEMAREIALLGPDDEEKKKKKVLLQWMRTYKVSLCVPAIGKDGKFLALLCLGEKLSGEAFSTEDIRFFEELAPSVTAAIERTYAMADMAEKMFSMEKLAAMGRITSSVAVEIGKAFEDIYSASKALPGKWNDKQFKERTLKTFPAEAEKMRLILEGMLGYARSTPPRFETVDMVDAAVRPVVLLLEEEFRKSGITFTEDIRLAPKIRGDKNMLKQMMLNLLLSAVHSLPQGGEVKLSLAGKDDNILLEVSQKGSKVRLGKKETLFDPFAKGRVRGTGFELAIVKRAVDEHKGRIEVDSENGKSAGFKISLPGV